METAIEKLTKLMKYADKEGITNLKEGLEMVLKGVDLEKDNADIKVKVSWSVGDKEDPGNYLSFDFKIG